MEKSSSKSGSYKHSSISYLDMGKGDDLQKCLKEIEQLKLLNKQLMERYDETVNIIRTAVGNLTTLGPTLTKDELDDMFTQLNEIVKKL